MPPFNAYCVGSVEMKLPSFLEKISWYQVIEPGMMMFRRRRLSSLVKTYPNLSDYRVLDVGGRPGIWKLLKEQYGIAPKELTLLNSAADLETFSEEVSDPETFAYTAVTGDGCNLPFADNSFDLTFSNSVIEHVGGAERVIRFAQECDRVGERVFIQTPNHWFPIEPHFVALFIHWLPRSLYRKAAFLSLNYALFSWRSQSLKRIFYEEFDSIRLLKRRDLQQLFPSKRIGREQVLGMTKSFIVMSKSPSP